MKRVVEFIGSQEAIPAIQLGHAGRKTSVTRPWEGGRPIPLAEGGWEGISASNRPFASGWTAPVAMTRSMIERSVEEFAALCTPRAGGRIPDRRDSCGARIPDSSVSLASEQRP